MHKFETVFSLKNKELKVRDGCWGDIGKSAELTVGFLVVHSIQNPTNQLFFYSLAIIIKDTVKFTVL